VRSTLLCIPLALALAALPSTALAATISWIDLDGGSFQDAGRWQDESGDPAVAPPGPGDGASFDLGPGDVSLSAPVALAADTEVSALGVLGGNVVLDLAGHDLEATSPSSAGALLVFPREAGREPSLVLENSAPALAAFRAPEGPVELSDGGTIGVQGGNTRLEASRVAVGVLNPDGASDAGTGSASSLTVSGATLGAVSRLDVGASQDGILVVEQAGQVVELPNGQGETGLGLFAGDAAGTTGSVVIRDAGTRVGAEGVVVGGRGEGSLSLEGGAELAARDRVLVGGLSTDGQTASQLDVSGGSRLEASLLQVGTVTDDEGNLTPGAGHFTLSDGTVDVDRFVANAGALSQLDLQGGQLSVSRFLDVDTGEAVALGGRLDLDFTRPQHRARFADEVILGAGSELRLEDGVLEAPALTAAGGSFVWNGGSLDLDGGATAGQAADALLPAELVLDAGRPSLRLGGTLTIDGDPSVDPLASGGAVTLAHGGSLDVGAIERVGGGSFTWLGGDLSLGSGLAIESGGLVGDSVTLDGNRSLEVGGATSIAPGASLALDGGTFRTATLTGDGFTWNAGSLEVLQLRAGTGPDALASGLALHAGRELQAGQLAIDDAVVTLAGGRANVGDLAIDPDAGGRLDFEGGFLRVQEGVTVGAGGITGTGGSATVRLDSGDQWLVGNLGGSTDDVTTIASGSTLHLRGGSFRSEGLAVEGTGALRFEAGVVSVDEGLRVGAGGVQDSGGTSTVTLREDDRLVAALGPLTVGDGSTVALEGGELQADAIALEGAGAVYYQSGGITVDEELRVGTGGVLGSGGASAVALGAGDFLDTGDRLVVGVNGTLEIAGGRIGATALDATAGAAHFVSGDVDVDGELSVSAAGLLGAGGATTVDVGSSSRLAADVLRVDSGHGVALQGGELQVDAIEGSGELDVQTGRLVLREQDLFIGSSFTSADTADADGDGVGDGYRLASNTAGGDDFFYRLGDGADVFVGTGHTTHVDGSGLEIQSGGSLSTWELETSQNVTVRPGGNLDVRHLVFDADSLFDGEAVAELVDVGAALTLGTNAKLFAASTVIAAGGSVSLQGDALLGGDATIEGGAGLSGTGTLEGDLVNSGSLEPGASPGELSVQGFFEQTDSGSLVLELGRDAETRQILHDALTVGGSVVLDGTLEILADVGSDGLDPAFDPAEEDGLSFTAITGERIQGSFDALAGTALGNDLKWVVEYFRDRVDLSVLSASSPDVIDHRLQVVPEPGTALLLGLGLAGLVGRRRSGRSRGCARPRSRVGEAGCRRGALSLRRRGPGAAR